MRARNGFEILLMYIFLSLEELEKERKCLIQMDFIVSIVEILYFL